MVRAGYSATYITFINCCLEYMLLSLFRPKRRESLPEVSKPTLVVDVHSHVLPGLDDGTDSLEESLQLLRSMAQLGVRKIVATPHIMGNYYRNTPDLIEHKRVLVQKAARLKGIDIEIEAAAEYYLDEYFIEMLRSRSPLLSFGKARYVLFETPFVNQPDDLIEAIELMQAQGYKPVLAHPERCLYLHKETNLARQLHRKGTLFQLNINSLAGYYSKQTQLFAEWLVAHQLVDFVASDIHRISQVDVLASALQLPYFQRCVHNGLINDTLL